MNILNQISHEVKLAIEALSTPPMSKKSGLAKCYYFMDILWSEFRYGTHPEDYIALWFWNKQTADRSLWLTSGNRKQFAMGFYTKEAFDLLGSKKLFNEKFAPYLKREWLCTNDASEEQIRTFIKTHGRVIVKPLSLSCGDGIEIIDMNRVDGFLQKVKAGEAFMVEELLKNHPQMARLNPDAVQTMRVETCIDKEGGFHLLGAFVMIGAPHSNVSNCHSGGVMCNLDRNTGKIVSDGYNPNGWSVAESPATKVPLHGFDIPYYDQLESFVKELAFVLPEARYVGWDVAITPEGFAVIEGNTLPGLCTQRVDSVPKLEMLKSYV